VSFFAGPPGKNIIACSALLQQGQKLQFVIKLYVRARATRTQTDSQDTSVWCSQTQTGATIRVLVLV